MKRKNQNKYYHSRVVTLIFVFVNIYQIFLREFSIAKYSLNYKSQIYKIKTMTYPSTNTHLKVFVKF